MTISIISIISFISLISMSTIKAIYSIKNGEMRLWLHDGQARAYDSTRRIVAITAGTQSGKTSFAPVWLLREIQDSGPGDYLFVTPTFQLLEYKALPEFRTLFAKRLKLGEYVTSPRRMFRFSQEGCRYIFEHGYDPDRDPETRVIFGFATDPESLESATIKAAVLDEAGQKKFKLGAWEAILRRLSLSMGRVLITTSVYALNWLKTKIFDAYQAGDPSIDVVRFDSTENPSFPREEFERARRDLPRWRFDMLYRGMFTRPAGLIYDCFERAAHLVPRFAIPREWKRYVGIDFGAQNTAAVFCALEPETGRLFLYRTYHAGGLAVRTHVRAILHGEPGIPHCVGGSFSENAWREEFRRAGLPVRAPTTNEVNVGITRVYSALQRGDILIFDDLNEFIEEKQVYAWVLDANGNPTDKIEDKETFHLLDAERYIVGSLFPSGSTHIQTARFDWEQRRLPDFADPDERTDQEIEEMLNAA